MNTEPSLEERAGDNRLSRFRDRALHEAKHLLYEVPTAAIGAFIGSEAGYYISEHVFTRAPAQLYYNLGWQDTQNILSYYGGAFIGAAVAAVGIRYAVNRIKNKSKG